MREYWLVHPSDRLVTIYLLEQGSYGKPDIRELCGNTEVHVLPDLAIDWGHLSGNGG